MKIYDWKNNWVLIIVRKNILNKTIIRNLTDFVNYFYYIILDITKLETILGRYKRKTKVVNIYDNKVREGQRYKNSNLRRR